MNEYLPFVSLSIDQILSLTNAPSSPFNKGGIKEGDYLTNSTKQSVGAKDFSPQQYEHQIDKLVYLPVRKRTQTGKLYNLTDEEIAIVEGKC